MKSLLLIFLLGVFDFSQPAQISRSSILKANDGPEPSEDSSDKNWIIGSALFSVGLLVTSILFASLCGWRTVRRVGNNIRNFFCPQYQHESDIPVAGRPPETVSEWQNYGYNGQTRSRIVFESIPSLEDLSLPHEPNVHSSRSINPLATLQYDDGGESPDLYAQDWFDEHLSNFPRTNIEYLRELGKGWFGSIIEAEAKDLVSYAKSIRVVVKSLRDDASVTETMQFLAENRVYRDADHPHILRLLGHSIETSPYFLIFEHFPQGDLKSFLLANVNRAELLNQRGDLIRMATDVARGLEWLSLAGYAVGDLAARNCQMGPENRVVIGDYGDSVSRFKEDYFFTETSIFPLRWAAPESIKLEGTQVHFDKVTCESNIWSFGVLLWEVCEFGKRPYSDLIDVDVLSKVIVDHEVILPMPKNPHLTHGESLYQLMTNCWISVPERRPKIGHILQELVDLQEDSSPPPPADDPIGIFL